MANPLVTYLQDHLAGAKFAVNLLDDLKRQDFDADLASYAAELLPEIEADRAVLQDLINGLGHEAGSMKEAAAWVAQKLGRFKLTLEEPLGRFEAIEMLSLGVHGKLALWTALRELGQPNLPLAIVPLADLIRRAETQATSLEKLRRQLAVEALK